MTHSITPVVLSDEEYEKFIPVWINQFSENVKAVWPNKIESKKAITISVVQALNASIGVMEIYDYFSISYPGIMHKAVVSESEQDELFQIFDEVMKEVCEELK